MTELLFDGDATTLPLVRFAAKEEARTLTKLSGAEFSGEIGSVADFHTESGRTIWTGTGPRSAESENSLRLAAAHAARKLSTKGARDIRIDSGRHAPYAGAITSGAILGAYHYNRFKGGSPEETGLRSISFAAGLDGTEKLAARQGAKVADAVNRVRDLGNTPPNFMTPAVVANEAEKYVRLTGATLTVFADFELAEMGFGGIAAVGAGSTNGPRLVILEHVVDPKWPTVALAGKTVTFDSGGLSLKKPGDLYEEKWDKMGGLAVLGILECVTALAIPVNLVAVLPVAENLPGPNAMRPGDVITMKNGKTVEIMDSDAEGRLRLADALSYIAEKYAPDLAIDLATLTGACVVALGQERTGLFTEDDDLAELFHKAGEDSGDACWRLPLGSDFAQELQSPLADLRNAGSSRWGGASKAAEFLRAFKGDGRWVHLDIAGTGMPDTDLGHMERGATGAGVRLVTEALRRLFS